MKLSEDFHGPLQAVQYLLEQFDKRGVIIGGVAVSLLAQPRFTADIDALLLLDEDEITELIEVAERTGLTPRIADAELFARRNRVVLLRHEDTGINVDISLGMLPFEVEAIARRTVFQSEDFALPIPTPEDLIVMKAVAHRPKDLVDIQALIEAHPDLDRGRVEAIVREFAQLLEQPELWEDIAPWLKEEME